MDPSKLTIDGRLDDNAFAHNFLKSTNGIKTQRTKDGHTWAHQQTGPHENAPTKAVAQRSNLGEQNEVLI